MDKGNFDQETLNFKQKKKKKKEENDDAIQKTSQTC